MKWALTTLRRGEGKGKKRQVHSNKIVGRKVKGRWVKIVLRKGNRGNMRKEHSKRDSYLKCKEKTG